MTQYKDALNDALKEAMKNKDTRRRDAIRLLTSAIKQVEIDTRREPSNDEVLEILQKEAKKRRESISELSGVSGREEQLEQEQYELSVIETFLPRQLTREEIVALAKETIATVNATTAKDIGKVMGALQPKVKGIADGKLVSEIVKELLG